MSSQDARVRLQEVLERVADATGLEVEVTVREDDAGLTGEFLGDDVGLLIGRHGQTIDAIQHLAYRIAMQGEAERQSVTVDAAGYRERRAEILCATADQAVQTAVSHQRAVPLEAMTALERKVIHEHLKGRPGIETYSEGQEPSRHLVVAPVVA